MRKLIKMLVFWAISLPLFYLFGLPFALEKLSTKVQRDSFAQCQKQLATEGMVGALNSPLRPDQAEHYCHCVSDKLTFTQADLMDAVKKQPPKALTAQAELLASECQVTLRALMGIVAPPPTAPAPPPAAAPAAAPQWKDDTTPIKL
jgi:hypothetical protein